MSDENSGFELTRRRLLGGITATGAAAAATGAGTFAYFRDTETSRGNQVQAGTANLDIHDGGDGVNFTVNPPIAPGPIKSDEEDYDYDAREAINLENSGSLRLNQVTITVTNTTVEDNDGVLQSDGVNNDSDSALDELDDDDHFETASGPDPDQNYDGNMASWVYVSRLQYLQPDAGDPPDDEDSVLLVDEGEPVEDSPGGESISKSGGTSGGFVSLQDVANASSLTGFTPPEPRSGSGDGNESTFIIEVELHPDTPNDFQGDSLLTDIQFTLDQTS